MAIESEILEKYPSTKVYVVNAPLIYVTDMTLRTKNQQGVVVSDVPQVDLQHRPVEAFGIKNDHRLELHCMVFDDNAFLNVDGQTEAHCEGCFMLDHERWLAFLEIKDCKPKNVSNHKAHALEQLIRSVERFRKDGIVQERRVYGIITFPRKLSYNAAAMFSPAELVRIKKSYGLLLRPYNKVTLTEDGELLFQN